MALNGGWAAGVGVMVEIKIDPDFKALIPPLSAEEYAGLETDIIEHGCRDPLVVAHWDDETALVDGHNRATICRANGIPFETVTLQLPSRARVALWIRENQLSRRNLTDDARAIISDEIREARSKLRMAERGTIARAAVRSRNPVKSDLSVTLSDKPKRDSRAEVARENKIPERKLRYARELREEAPKLAAAVRHGDTTLMAAMRDHRQVGKRAAVEDVATRAAKEVEGRYDVIVIDPPWPLGRIGFGAERLDTNAPLDYRVMNVEEIEKLVGEKLARHAFENCHVFLWTTQRFLPIAFAMLDVWSLDYGFTMTWKKPAGPKPLDLPTFNSEFVLYARKGSPKFLDTTNFYTCFEAPRREHSAKPQEFYDTLRRVTGGRRLDMFNRRAIVGQEAA